MTTNPTRTETERGKKGRSSPPVALGKVNLLLALLVLVLLGFAATDFMITMTLSAADATAHLIHNPVAPGWLQDQNVPVTLFLLGPEGADAAWARS